MEQMNLKTSLREFLKSQNEEWVLNDKSDLGFVVLDIYILKDLLPFLLKDSYQNLRSPQFQIAKYIFDCLERDFIYDTGLAPNPAIFKYGPNIRKIKARFRPEFVDFFKSIHVWYNANVNTETSFYELLNGTVNFELVCRHKPERLRYFFTDEWYSDETKAKILLGVRPREKGRVGDPP